MNTHQFELLTDHFQFLFGDAIEGPRADTTNLWDADGSIGVIEEEPVVIGVATVRHGGRTTVLLGVHESRPAEELGWRSLGEFTLSLPSGKVLLWAPETDDVEASPSLALEPGTYRGVAMVHGDEEVSDEKASEGPDRYKVVLWRN